MKKKEEFFPAIDITKAPLSAVDVQMLDSKLRARIEWIGSQKKKAIASIIGSGVGIALFFALGLRSINGTEIQIVWLLALVGSSAANCAAQLWGQRLQKVQKEWEPLLFKLDPCERIEASALNAWSKRHPEVLTYLAAIAAQGRQLTFWEFHRMEQWINDKDQERATDFAQAELRSLIATHHPQQSAAAEA